MNFMIVFQLLIVRGVSNPNSGGGEGMKDYTQIVFGGSFDPFSEDPCKTILGSTIRLSGSFRPVAQCLQVLYSSGITWILIDHPFEHIAVTTFMGDGANRDAVE